MEGEDGEEEDEVQYVEYVRVYLGGVGAGLG